MDYSGFRALHPLPCFVYFLGAMLLSMLLLHPGFLIVSTGLLLVLSYRLKGHEGGLLNIGWMLLFGLVLFALNPLFSHRGEHILFYLWEQPITLESVVYGLTLSLSTLSLIVTFQCYSKVITADKFLYLFASVWPKGSLVTVMGMRFVPLLKARLRTIGQVQQTKGISLTEGRLAKRAGDGMKLLQILLTWSLEDALQTADSMKARGFGLKSRSTYKTYRMRSRDWRALGLIIVPLLICILGRWTGGYGLLVIYPSLEFTRMSWGDWLYFAVFVFYLGIPWLWEGKELLWRYSK
ncbi:energy-coupling factor transporter transmembrane component T [Paenibacillus chartarius]|uniref:Energy-coupling factor transporter transmembrane component T n=1 Tax=Paenibacillus chartarius TaxID=747481 RepID=A0ABV6DFY0_9BACL